MQLKPVVYLIDDDEVNFFLVKHVLADTYPECILIYINSVHHALQVLKEVKNDPLSFPALILLDLHMPEKDGWDFLDEYTVLQDTTLSQCDVVILTCAIFTKDTQRAKKYPFVADFIEKPFTASALTYTLNKILHSKKCT